MSHFVTLFSLTDRYRYITHWYVRKHETLKSIMIPGLIDSLYTLNVRTGTFCTSLCLFHRFTSPWNDEANEFWDKAFALCVCCVFRYSHRKHTITGAQEHATPDKKAEDEAIDWTGSTIDDDSRSHVSVCLALVDLRPTTFRKLTTGAQEHD